MLRMASERRPIIHRRRFWWRYPDGRMEPIVATPRIRGHLCQVEYQMGKDVDRAEGAG